MSNPMHTAFERMNHGEAVPQAASRGFDVVRVWPELFEGLSDASRNGIRQAVAANWHEGWTPDRAAVADLVARAQGEMTRDELHGNARRRAAETKS